VIVGGRVSVGSACQAESLSGILGNSVLSGRESSVLCVVRGVSEHFSETKSARGDRPWEFSFRLE
jgi:hypothetical protein